MNGKFLLDTNIIIALFAKDTNIIERLTNAQEVFVPSIAVGELFYGAFNSTRPAENQARITEFVNANVVLSCNAVTAQNYGLIKRRLKEQGRPLPENDIWIAAIALQNDLTLITRDAHFKNIDDLRSEIW